ncbi:MAG: type I-E CRISPR-associated protein Cse1/CasA [Blastocatellales bacterium]|nr:type I-E CRISPR-associated protein Cse1/CasA [Blastocatellales bacterium]
MMPSFNLIDEQWIPCVMANGGPRELSLHDVLVEAGQVREIFDASPLITASLHRLLLAVLWRCFPLRSLADWRILWQQQRFDADKLGAYFDQWHERFYLLHPETPFYQLNTLELSKRTPLKRLGWEFAAGNNATLFDHSSDDDRPVIQPNVAARWIIATHCFAASAGRGEKDQLHTKDSPWTRGAVTLINGDNLFETLVFNLLNLVRNDFPLSEKDIPIWETTGTWVPAHNQIPDGLLEYLTWQSRAIKLLPDSWNELRECYFAQGRAIEESFKVEPMYAYKRDQKLGLLVWQFSEDRAMWRDSHSLFNLADDAPFQIPQALHHLARLVREKTLNRDRLYRLQVLGQCLESGQPTIHFWRNDRLPLHADYLNYKALLDNLRSAISLGEEVAKILQNSVYMLAGRLLEFISQRQPDKKDIQQMMAHLQTEAFYWSQLETHFKHLLADLPNDQSHDENGELVYGKKALADWARKLNLIANEAFQIATRSLDGSSRGLKAVAIAQGGFNQKLRTALSSYINTTPTGGAQ